MNDKALHGAIGFGIGAVIGLIITPYTGFGLAVAVGVAKEVWDHFKGGDVDLIGDVAATAIGGGFGAGAAAGILALL